MTTEPSPADATISARALAGAEIMSIMLSCLIAEWVFLSFFSRHRWLIFIPLLLAVSFMVLSHAAYKEMPRDLGFRLDNFLAAARLLIGPTLIAVLIIFLVGWYLTGPPSLPRLLRPRLLLVPCWAFFQQSFLQGCF